MGMLGYLFSSPPDPFPAALVELVRDLLAGKTTPLVGYLPAGSLERHFVREARAIFRGVAELSAMKPEVHTLGHLRSLLKRADLLFIPGGNTYLMAQRLHQAGILAELRQRILDGLPLVTFSAGTVLCGADILTTNDINCCGCTQFTGLGLAPCSFNAHYPSNAGAEKEERDERLAEYLAFHSQPVLALADGACLRLTAGRLEVLSGQVWKLTAGMKVGCDGLTWQPDSGT